MTRKELLKAALNFGADALPEHVNSCKECMDDLAWLARYRVAGNLPLAEPPGGWVERAVAIATVTKSLSRTAQLLARLTFDSWTLPEAVGVRSGVSFDQRRMRFECDEVALDLRGEHGKAGWSFVAQLMGKDVSSMLLRAEQHRLTPDSHGICQWSSSKPPRTIFIETETYTIQIPEFSWSRTQPK